MEREFTIKLKLSVEQINQIEKNSGNYVWDRLKDIIKTGIKKYSPDDVSVKVQV